VPIGVAFIALIALGNLRGIRESGNIFAVPTYVFIFSICAMIAVGLVRLALGIQAPSEPPVIQPVEGLGLFLILRAFASGCTAMTGVEAISNGVPAFKPPESVNASKTLVWMVTILGVMFAGITILAHQLGIVPSDSETVVSQIARVTFGTGFMYYLIQFSTMLILVLAANTSFADFPRLSSIMARDGYMPHSFAHRGERLAFSNGIIVLAVFSIVLLVAFGGQTDALIPLYAIGVFASFTLSQFGMVIHHAREREPGWRHKRVINGLGAATTAVVTVIIAVTKFVYGAWIVLIIIPIIILLLLAVKRHYDYVARVTKGPARLPKKFQKIIVVPVAKLDAVSQRTLAFAQSLVQPGDDLVAVHVGVDSGHSELVRQWTEAELPVRLVYIESPYRALTRPLLAYLDGIRRTRPEATLTVCLPEFVPSHWHEHFLHNQSALRLKAALLFRPNTVVVDVPYWPEAEVRSAPQNAPEAAPDAAPIHEEGLVPS
jgi:hypothetical protein